MAMQDIASIGFTTRTVVSPNQHFWNHKKSWDIHLLSVKLPGCVYSQYIKEFTLNRETQGIVSHIFF